MKKKITVLTACYNEEENVAALAERVREIMKKETSYSYEHLFIDNASKDRTVAILREVAKNDAHVKVIVNARNFGHIRSPFYGFLQSSGDAVISLVADFQDPPEMIPQFLRKWEEGARIVIGVKNKSMENKFMFFLRRVYYCLMDRIADIEHIQNFTGFGLYDRAFVDILHKLDDPYPYFRGIVAELGFDRVEIEYDQPRRKEGRSKNNFFTLYDMAMLGFVNHSKAPIRFAGILGFILSIISLCIAVAYLVMKVARWDSFLIGVAPITIGMFFFGAVQLFFIGIIGEYIGAVFTQVRKRPYVIEKERINFGKKVR